MAWVIVGLGNPGDEYVRTRHNAGRMALDHIAAISDAPSWKIDKKSNARTTGITIDKAIIALVEPNTYMNASGTAVRSFVKTVKAAERLIVVYDDLDVPLGTIKVSFDRGSGGHKGVDSIAAVLKTKKFVRIRIGISPRGEDGVMHKPKGAEAVEDFILSSFRPNEMEILATVFGRVDAAVRTIVTYGVTAAMNEYN